MVCSSRPRRRAVDFGGVGRGLGVHQGQPLDPLGRAAQDLEGDVAAHREAGEREASAAPASSAASAIAPIVSWCHSSGTTQSAMSARASIWLLEDPARVEQAGQQDERRLGIAPI